MKSVSNILIYGAGEIARGCLPWFFNESEHYYVDTNLRLINIMKKNKKLSTYRIRDEKMDQMIVPISGASGDIDDFKDVVFDAIFLSAECCDDFEVVSKLKKYRCPIVLLDNNPLLLNEIKGKCHIDNIFLAVPDIKIPHKVQRKLIGNDELAVVVDDGALFIDSYSELSIDGDYILCNLHSREFHQISPYFF